MKFIGAVELSVWQQKVKVINAYEYLKVLSILQAEIINQTPLAKALARNDYLRAQHAKRLAYPPEWINQIQEVTILLAKICQLFGYPIRSIHPMKFIPSSVEVPPSSPRTSPDLVYFQEKQRAREHTEAIRAADAQLLDQDP